LRDDDDDDGGGESMKFSVCPL